MLEIFTPKNMYIYTGYHLCIHSEVPLPDLAPAEGDADVTVRLGSLSHLSQTDTNRGNCVLGELEGIGKLLVTDGKTILIDPLPGVTETMLAPNILGAGMSVILRQRGLLVLHASAVAMNGKAVAFMGGSGWGKSTLAKALHDQGHQLITDDVLAIQTNQHEPIVFPAFPRVKLWPEAATFLGHDINTFFKTSPNALKLSCRFNHGFQETPLPLVRIYVLAKGDAHEITPLPPQDAFADLVRHTRAVNVLTEDKFLASHLQQCSSLIRQISFCRFTRKPSLADLPYLVKLVETDILENQSIHQGVVKS